MSIILLLGQIAFAQSPEQVSPFGLLKIFKRYIHCGIKAHLRKHKENKEHQRRT